MKRLLFLLSLLSALSASISLAQNVTLPPDDVLAPITAENARELTVVHSEMFNGTGIREMTLGADGTQLLISGPSQIGPLLNLETGEIRELPIEPARNMNFVSLLNPSGTRIAVFEANLSGALGDTAAPSLVSLWDATTAEHLLDLYEPLDYTELFRLNWLPDNHLRLYTCPEGEFDEERGFCTARDRVEIIWDADGNEVSRRTVSLLLPTDNHAVFDPDTRRLFRMGYMGEDAPLNILVQTLDETNSVVSEEVIETDIVAPDFVTRFTLSPDGNQLAVTFGDGSIVLYSTDSLEPLWTLEDAYTYGTEVVQFDPSGTLLVTSGGSGTTERTTETGVTYDQMYVREDAYLRVWNATNGELLWEYDVHVEGETRDAPISQIKFTPDSRYLIFGGRTLNFAAVLDGPTCEIQASGVNTREEPTTQSAQAGTLDGSASAVAQVEGNDGFIWWRLLDGRWVRSDVVQAEGSCADLPMME